MTAIYPTPENPAFGAFVKTQVDQIGDAGVDVELLVLRGANRKLMYARAVGQLRRRLRDPSIDLIHAHYSYVGFVARAQRRLPVVVSFLGDDLLGTPDANGRTRPLSRMLAAAGRELADHVDAVIVKSGEMARLLRRRDVHVIPNGVDFEVFRPVQKEEARRALGLERGKRYLLFPANPGIPRKNFPLAQAAAAKLQAALPDVELLVVHREPQERLALFMNACDVLLFPSYQEGSPNIVKQAMACDTPIVGTDVGDMRELFADAEGLEISAFDEDEFAERARRLLLRGRRSQGRETIRHLAGPAVAGRVIDVYESVLRQARSAAG
jgi:teichuronic acid biosynthesis glycosyltransferase TuaC